MRQKNGLLRGLWIGLAVFVLLIVLSGMVIHRAGRSSQREETEFVLSSVRSAALTCYAVEGAYPGNLEYLKEHYGLYYDENVYTVSYSAFASNIFPDIYVMEGGEGLQ